MSPSYSLQLQHSGHQPVTRRQIHSLPVYDNHTLPLVPGVTVAVRRVTTPIQVSLLITIHVQVRQNTASVCLCMCVYISIYLSTCPPIPVSVRARRSRPPTQHHDGTVNTALCVAVTARRVPAGARSTASAPGPAARTLHRLVSMTAFWRDRLGGA